MAKQASAIWNESGLDRRQRLTGWEVDITEKDPRRSCRAGRELQAGYSLEPRIAHGNCQTNRINFNLIATPGKEFFFLNRVKTG
jgi:hypothetical protein